jgi:hypothetical protein
LRKTQLPRRTVVVLIDGEAVLGHLGFSVFDLSDPRSGKIGLDSAHSNQGQLGVQTGKPNGVPSTSRRTLLDANQTTMIATVCQNHYSFFEKSNYFTNLMQ